MPGRTSSTSETPRKKPSPSNVCVAAVDDDTAHRRLRAASRYDATRSRCSRVISGPISDVGIGARADAQRREPLRDRVDEPVGDVADRDDDRDRHAPLARRAVRGRDRGVGGDVDVGVGQHDHVVLRAAERLHALAVRGAGHVDVARDRGRADEADRRDVGVLEQAVDRDRVAVHDVEHAVGQSGFGEQLGEQQRRRRVLLARLQHERVAARDRGGEHPQRHHRREVEGRDAGDDAERLADRVHVDVGRGLLGESALEQRGDAARELDVLDAARDLARRVGAHLAVLRREHGGDLGAVLVEQVTEAEQDLGAARQRRPAPPRERLRRGRHRVVDLVDARETDLRLLLARSPGRTPARCGPTSTAPACRRSSGRSSSCTVRLASDGRSRDRPQLRRYSHSPRGR